MKHKNTIKSRYDDLGGSHYDMRYTDEQQAKYELILDELPDASLVLDNGCGTGLLFPFIDSTLVGLDLSGELLRTARERSTDAQFLVQGDSEYLPFRDDVFYAVVSVTVIQNLVDPRRLPVESARVAKLGSTVIISSLKRVYGKVEDITSIVENEDLLLNRVFTDENINDWITVSTKKQ
ncbi:MAG: methyltransferase domain-containing protein [Candidatus Bathyarchaeota archaeon]|nr:methyltransferase domain-containing protein [Candidatus Bathyarchaeota archaeon]